MRFWREIADDRSSGGVLCVILMLMFVAQVALAGRAAAATVAPDPLSLVCTSHAGAHRPADPDHGRQCPCAELCGAGLHLLPALGPTDGVGLPIRFSDRVEIARDPAAALPAAPIDRLPHATGPPRLLERS